MVDLMNLEPPYQREEFEKVLPWLSALYGLKWADVVDMPAGELRQYLQQQHTIGSCMSGVPRSKRR